MARLSVLPSTFGTVSASGMKAFAVQWLACTLPCRRFADILTDACARLGADADRYSFTVRDLHPLLLAGFAGALRNPSQFLPPAGAAIWRTKRQRLGMNLSAIALAWRECQRRREIALASRSKNPSARQASRPPISGACLLAGSILIGSFGCRVCSMPA
jgi:hypothetical protein